MDIVVSGAGNLPLWPTPKVPWPADARVYEEGTDGALHPVGNSPAAFAPFVEAEIKSYAEMVRAAGISPE